MSSDALLMNLLCHPESRRLLERLEVAGPVEFGIGGSVPKAVGGVASADETEIDALFRSPTRGRVGLVIEAKLTEADFSRKRIEVVETYLGLQGLFDVGRLPSVGGDYLDYQLIRNLLAAEYHGARFVLLYDERRPDLAGRFGRMLGHVRSDSLQARCQAITWQELAGRCPKGVQAFLSAKYGIEPRE